ncbi:MAG TPA: aromatic amino acid ammonia-lyase [Gaiellaceae bacterium]
MITLGPATPLDLARYRRVVQQGERVELDPAALDAVEERRAAMLAAVAGGARAYGVTTGLGYMASRAIPAADQAALQRSILLGRSVAVGDPLPRPIVRGAMLLRLCAFLHGDAAVGAGLCRFLADRLNDGWTPYVPEGPDGAAGEVIPLSHLFQTFVGEGFVLEAGIRVPAAEALRARGVAPYEPALKEGIALVNGAVVAPALAVALVDRARSLLEQATVSAALAAAAAGASWRPYSPRVGRLKGDPGQMRVHEQLAALGDGAWLDLPQAPVSLRVVPQVHGAVHDLLDDAERQLEREVAAVTDSPLYLPADGAEPEGFYPSGNFHAQSVAFRLDAVAIGAAQVANLLEKRVHRLLDARFSGLPEQLAETPGSQTGASVLHKAVVGLCAENRLLAAPASVVASDTSAGQEDVQAFALLAGSKLRRILDNLELALAYELVALRQASHLRDAPASPALEAVAARLAAVVEPLGADRPLAPDVEAARELVRSGELV